MTCQHESILLVEGGHERTWSWVKNEDGSHTAIFHGLEDYSDEGDGVYKLRCVWCLEEFEVPDEGWDWD